MNDKISQTVKQYKEAKEVGADVSDFLDLNNPKIREAFADENSMPKHCLNLNRLLKTPYRKLKI